MKTKCSNTSNLWTHLKVHHPQEHVKLKPPTVTAKRRKTISSENEEKDDQIELVDQGTRPQQKENRTLLSFIPYESSNRKHKLITEAIARFIAKDILPIYTVSKPGFINLLKVLDPRYKIPSYSYFKRTAIPAMYSRVSYACYWQLLLLLA